MKDVEHLVSEYVSGTNIMQLATSKDGQPWICTVHIYNDGLDIYWISTESRRHSADIADNNKVAAYVLVHENTPDEPYVVGLSMEGTAKLVGQEIDGIIDKAYAKKHGKKPEFMSDIKNGKNPHRFYKFVPRKVALFDTKNFPTNPRQEWAPHAN